MLFFCCAVSYVSSSIEGFGNDFNCGSEGVLRGAEGPLGLFCAGGRRSRRGFEAPGDWDKWQDQSPFLDQRQGHGHEGSSGQTAKTEVPGERKLKMTQVIDQSDDGEFVVQ